MTQIQGAYTIFILLLLALLLSVLLVLVWRRHHPTPRSILKREEKNPILQPIEEHDWESEAVFNPAALYLNGRVHLLYRALGRDGVSRLGYASSSDGIHFDERSPQPVFQSASFKIYQSPDNPRYRNPFREEGRAHYYDRVRNPSGGGWAGSEDPRVVELDNKVFLTYNSFDTWQSIRVAFSSLGIPEFLAKSWLWQRSVFLSPKGSVHKNWVFFPEKINGKYALLHNLHGEDETRVRITYVDESGLGSERRDVESPDPQAQPNKAIAWHHRVRSAGPPPIRTKEGWLVLYHATDKSESHRYKIGALLLSLKEPTIILGRCQVPILAPDRPYENDWKPGIVYSCGAIIKDDELYVYYGGGDKTINLATVPLAKLTSAILHNRSIVVERRSVS